MDDLSFYRDFRYRGLSTAQLDALIDQMHEHGYNGLIEEIARLRLENALLQQQGASIDAQDIGQIIQVILDRGFFVSYTFDRSGGVMKAHRFGIWKYHGKEMIVARVAINNSEVKRFLVTALPLLEQRMREIDEQIAQRQPTEEALDG